jgi:enoyl-CoA hydratase/carnithine racemase
VDAHEAIDIRLVNKIVDSEVLLDQAIELCRSINQRLPLALKLSRIAIDQGLHTSFEQIRATHTAISTPSASSTSVLPRFTTRLSIIGAVVFQKYFSDFFHAEKEE